MLTLHSLGCQKKFPHFCLLGRSQDWQGRSQILKATLMGLKVTAGQ